jgi:D-serine deaminase-like pyridoxal phosphate-dependent protein
VIAPTAPGTPRGRVPTPALLLDMGAVERNIAKMAAFFAGSPCRLRPHAKTHKLPLIARRQVEAGAVGITCATLTEAEVFLDAGIASVLVANEVVGAGKIDFLVEQSRRGDLIVCVDDPANARDISRAAVRAGTRVSVLVEVNVGLDRCGVPPGEPARELARAVSAMEGIAFRGIMGYEGGVFTKDAGEKERRCAQANRLLVETARLLERGGIAVGIVTAGGSNTFGITGIQPGITDVQVGSYVTMDLHNRAFGIDFEQAVTVLATVISRPEAHRAVTDAGKKSLSTDEGLPVCTLPGVSVSRLNEEHGILAVEECAGPLSAGDTVELVPAHGCTTIPLYDHYVALRDGVVEAVLPILPRGTRH